MIEGEIVRVAGPLVVAIGLTDAKMYDVVKVGSARLMGEIIELRGGLASIQVYEETAGLGPGDKVWATGEPLSLELGPGLLSSIYDGVQRPLDVLFEKSGSFMDRGIEAPGLSREKIWAFVPVRKEGDDIGPGDIIGTVEETNIITHKIMVPHDISGKIVDIKAGDYTVEDAIAQVETSDGEINPIKMMQRWPVRVGRPYANKKTPDELLVTGQRVIDTLFPIAKGGTACVPGPFGSGKTVIQHQLGKWADAEVIIFIGCGERGNEMTDVLIEFPELIDPHSGKPLMERTVLIANTSNMPVAAREASIYTGITIAEYFRDMGYNVALQADSTSRWAEALREISGRLEEMPGEEGYPAYLSSRLAAFYERAGVTIALGKPERQGSITAIGSVSPPGGDLSEPVVQATLRVVKVFWGLEDKLAYERHFPAINWLISYSLYADSLEEWWNKNVDKEFRDERREAIKLLQIESELREIVRLVGVDALSLEERLILETAKSIREDFLQQNAFFDLDTYTSPKRQFKLLDLIMTWHSFAKIAVEGGMTIERVVDMPVRERIARAKLLTDDEIGEFDKIKEAIMKELDVSELVVEI
ncbi:MAG TPA: V-type ATP synthase subunit A [Actinobacteria bacterium]|nr:V-type ATP synthase subunit A [Actinomycetota bacterium]